MSPKKRRVLFIIAFIIFAVAAAALIYAWLPSDTLRDTLPVTPTYLIPPAGVP